MKVLMETGGNGFGSGPRLRDLWVERQVLCIRSMLEAATKEKMREICEQLMEKAAKGSIEAVKLVLRFLMGSWSTQLEQLVDEESVRESTSEREASQGEAVDVVADEPSVAEEAGDVVADEPSVAEEAVDVVADEPSVAEEAGDVVADEPSVAEVSVGRLWPW